MTAPDSGWSTCSIDPPNPSQWLVLDLEADKPQEWAAETAAKALGEDAAEPMVKAFTEDLAWYVARARAEGAFIAAVYQPGLLEPITLFLHVTAVEAPESGDPLEQLERRLRSPRPYVLGEAAVDVVDLPAGRAVRVRESAGAPISQDAAEVMEYVTHYVRPEGALGGPMIAITQTWGSLPLGEVYSAMADAVAQSLTVQYGFTGGDEGRAGEG